MPHQRLLQSIICLSLLLALAACHSTRLITTPTSIPLKNPPAAQVSTLAPSSSPVLWTADFTPTVSIAAMGNATHEEIIHALFEQWLRHYRTGRAAETYRLDDYEIQKIDLSKKGERVH